MKKYSISIIGCTLIMLICTSVMYAVSSQRNYRHSNAQLNLEFDNIYFKFQDVVDITTIQSIAGKKTFEEISVATLTVTTLYSPGIQIKIGEFTCPGATGDKAVTGVGFQPRYVEFESFRSNDNRIKYSSGVMDYSGNQHVITMAWSGSAGETLNATNACIYNITEGEITQVQAAYVSMDSDGFTVNFSVVNTNYSIYWKAVR